MSSLAWIRTFQRTSPVLLSLLWCLPRGHQMIPLRDETDHLTTFTSTLQGLVSSFRIKYEAFDLNYKFTYSVPWPLLWPNLRLPPFLPSVSRPRWSLRKSNTVFKKVKHLPRCLGSYSSFCPDNHRLGREHPEHRWDSETRRTQSLRETYNPKTAWKVNLGLESVSSKP